MYAFDSRDRSRSPPDTLQIRLRHLEDRIISLEGSIKELLAERRWWTWWYDAWGKWLQSKVCDVLEVHKTLANTLFRFRLDGNVSSDMQIV